MTETISSDTLEAMMGLTEIRLTYITKTIRDLFPTESDSLELVIQTAFWAGVKAGQEAHNALKVTLQ